MKGLARNTSQVLFCNRLRQNKHFSGSAQRQHAQCSRPIEHTAAVPRATWFLDAAQLPRDCALPHDSAHENRL